MTRLLSLLIALIICNCLYGQFFNYNESDGLPSNTIRSIYKSKQGKLWVGTESGLVSFNGKDVKNYFDKKGYVFASCWSITEDKNNHIWASFYGSGVAKYDGDSFEFYDDQKGLPYNHVRKVFYSETYDCILALTERGLAYLPAGAKEFITVSKEKKFFNQYNDIREHNGKVLISSNPLGVYEFSINKDKEADLTLIPELRGGLAFHVNNDLYYSGIPSSGKVLQEFNPKTKELTQFKLPSIPWAIESDREGNNYVATWGVNKPIGSVYLFDGSDFHNLLENSGLSQTGFWCLEYDETENLLWFGSLRNGLYAMPIDKSEFDFGKKLDALNNNHLKQVFHDSKGYFWLLDQTNLVVMNSDYETVQQIDFSVLKIEAKQFLKDNNELSKAQKEKLLDAIVNDLFCYNITESKDHVFINTNVGLFEFETNNGFDLVHYEQKSRGLNQFDNSGKLLYCRQYRQVVRIPDYHKWDADNEPLSLKDANSPRDISRTQRQGDLLWLGTHFDGLFVYEKEKSKSLLNSDEFYENAIVDVQAVGDNEQIVTGKSGKVYLTSYYDNKFTINNIIDVEKDFQTNAIAFARLYNDHIFIGSSLGLLVYDSNCEFKKLVPHNHDNNFIDCIYNKTKDELVISCHSSLYRYKVKNLVSSYQRQIQLKIDQINIDDQEVKFCKEAKICLDHYENDIKVNFSANNLLFKEYNKYAFKIENQINNWNNLGEKGEIKLFQLKPGTYNIWIKGRNLVTGIAFKPILFTIVIQKPFWQTIWFILGVTLLISFSLIIFVRWRVIKKQRKKQVQLKLDNELLEAKMNTLRAQMNPHFTFNAINSIQNYIIDNDTTSSLFYLGAFSKLIRLLLESTDEQMIPLAKEVEFLESYLAIQKMRFQKINYQLEVDQTIQNPSVLKIPSLIIQPFIENVFEHAFSDADIKEPNLLVKFSSDKNTLICSVEDNGCGYNAKLNSENLKHKSLATKIVSERLKLLKEDLNEDTFDIQITNLADIDPNQTGTKIEVKFPMCYN